jgi:hypothetical protein
MRFQTRKGTMAKSTIDVGGKKEEDDISRPGSAM